MLPAGESSISPSEPEAPKALRAPHHPWRLPGTARWASTLGALGAALLVAAPFLTWLRVREAEAERFGRALAEAAAREPAGAGTEGFAALGARLEASHALSGLDLVQWSREARLRLRDPRSEAAADPETRAQVARGWTLVPIVVLGMGGAALVLVSYLVWHRLGRLRPPMQVLAGVAAGIALALAGGLTWLLRSLEGTVVTGPGHLTLLVGGTLLLVALVGTVRVIHLVGVLLATALTLFALGALAWAYVTGGSGS